MRLSIYSITVLMGVVISGVALGANAQESQVERPQFTPPAPNTIPDDDFGHLVRLGQDYFLNTKKLLPEYIGSNLNCVNCHLDAGRQRNSAPLWAAYVIYPQYRKKNKHVNSLAERLQGCFKYSMNGKVPAADSEVIRAISTYMFWMAKNAPVGVFLEGQGFKKIKRPENLSLEHGQKVFEQKCAVCHGMNGEGQYVEGQTVFPPLWGDHSFNWGAGMHSLKNAAAFIRANMPLSKGGTLSDQEAWDVAYYLNSHERPQDPRFNGNLKETVEKYHSNDDTYGKTIKGVLLGEKSIPSWGNTHKD